MEPLLILYGSLSCKGEYNRAEIEGVSLPGFGQNLSRYRSSIGYFQSKVAVSAPGEFINPILLLEIFQNHVTSTTTTMHYSDQSRGPRSLSSL